MENVTGFIILIVLIVIATKTFSFFIPKHIDIKNEKVSLDNFFVDFTENGNYENLKNIAKKYGLFIDNNPTGNGKNIFNISATKETAKAISLKTFATEYYSFETGNYFITIRFNSLEDNSIESVKYINNVDFIIAYYTVKDGYAIRDLNRLTPATFIPNDDGTEDASAILPVNTAQDIINYVPVEETGISPLEEFYCTLKFGTRYEDITAQIPDAGLYMAYARGGDYITFGKYIDNIREGTCIIIDFEYDILTKFEFWDYVVNQKEDMHISYISSIQAKDESDLYTQGMGYYVIGPKETKKFDNAHEAIQYLHSFR